MRIFSRKPLSDQDIPHLWELLQALPLRRNQKKQRYHAISDTNVATNPSALDRDSSASEGLAARVQNFSDLPMFFLITALACSVHWQFLCFISVWTFLLTPRVTPCRYLMHLYMNSGVLWGLTKHGALQCEGGRELLAENWIHTRNCSCTAQRSLPTCCPSDKVQHVTVTG